MIRSLFIAFALTLMAATAMAVEPDEVLSDPLLETRARSISKGLRCLQCQNESIDESSAGIARDLRILVRDRLVEGDTDTEVVDFVVARYGEFVLLRPNGRGANLILWLAGPVLLLLTMLSLWLVMRKGQGHAPAVALSKAEKAALKEVLDDRA